MFSNETVEKLEAPIHASNRLSFARTRVRCFSILASNFQKKITFLVASRTFSAASTAHKVSHSTPSSQPTRIFDRYWHSSWYADGAKGSAGPCLRMAPATGTMALLELVIAVA
jgi:hypothetical protein